jgi:histidyl-tRNA synthetase
VERMFEPVRGMRDVLPEQQRVLTHVRNELESELRQWGYQMLDLPVLERREWYLKKAGEELVGKLYDFVHHGRGLSLRPEWTVSVLRAFLHTLQSEPLPLRLAYSGPVFRYERPQRATFRQFTQVGVELIGGAAPLADVEVIQLACSGLQRTGVGDYSITVGHIGVVQALLQNLNLADRTANLLLWNMERLRQGRSDAIKQQLAEANSNELFDLGPLADLPDEQLEHLLLTMLHAVGLRLDNSTRAPEAIVSRLVRKLRRDDPQPRIDRALELMERLAATRGAPDVALAQLDQLFTDEGIDKVPLDELRAILQLLGASIAPERLIVDAGMGRGLHYYTGLIFEINAANGLQLCGGGRYDELVTTLGGRASVPAIGFAYGLERVAMVADVLAVPLPDSVLVMAEHGDVYSATLSVAEYLRNHGYIALVDVRERSFQANMRDAAKRRATAVVICDERAPEYVRWYSLSDRSERVIQLSNIA